MGRLSSDGGEETKGESDNLYAQLITAIDTIVDIRHMAYITLERFAKDEDKLTGWQRENLLKFALRDIRDMPLPDVKTSDRKLQPESTGRADDLPQQQAPRSPLGLASIPAARSKTTAPPITPQPNPARSPPQAYSRSASASKTPTLPSSRHPPKQQGVHAAEPGASRKLQPEVDPWSKSTDKPSPSTTSSAGFPPLSQGIVAGQAFDNMPKGTVRLSMPDNRTIKEKAGYGTRDQETK